MPVVRLPNGIDIMYCFEKLDDKAEILVFMNGTFNVLKDWKNIGNSLSKNNKFNILTFDMRNQGGSTKIANDFEYDDILSDVQLLIEHLNLSDFTIIGYSSGSAIAVDYVFHNPGKVKRLIMGAPVVNPFGAFNSHLISKASLRMLELGDVEDLVLLTYPLMFSNNFCEINKEHFSAIQGMFCANFHKSIMLPYMKAWDGNNIDLPKLQIVVNSVETHYIYGEEDIFNSNEYVQELKHQLNELNVYEIGNAGHAFHLEKAGEYIRILNHILVNHDHPHSGWLEESP